MRRHWFAYRLHRILSRAMTFHVSARNRNTTHPAIVLAGYRQGFIYRPDRPNRRGPVPVYRSGLAGNRSVPVEFKFKFKIRSSTSSYRYTGRLDQYTGQFGRYTGDLKKHSDGSKITVYRPVRPVYRPVWPVYRWFKEIFRRLQNRSRVWNKSKFRHELCKY